MLNKSVIIAFLILSIFLINVTLINAQEGIQISVVRNIQIYPGFVVIQDKIQIKGQASNLTIYLSPSEYRSLYSVYTNPKYPIMWGAIKNDYPGFTIPLNGYQGNITVTRVYDNRVFNTTGQQVKMDLFAYLTTDYPINTLNTTIKFTYPVSNINIASPKNATQKYINGTNFITYAQKNLNSFNTTSLSISFTPSKEIPWVKIASLYRNVIIDNLDNIKVVDTVVIEYIGFNSTVTTWIPNLLPNSTVISVQDDLGGLSYTNNAVSLRYPLMNTYYPNAILNYTREKIILTSEINIKSLGFVDPNTQKISLSLNALQNNFYIIDNFTLAITIKYSTNVQISPIPDQLIIHQDGRDYLYKLYHVDPTTSLNVKVEGTINPFITSINLLNQVLFVIAILSFLIFAYQRFVSRAVKIREIKIPEIPRLINLVESLMLNIEEIEQLDSQLEKGTIKKSEYTLRFNSLRREIEAKEKDFKALTNTLISKYPETKTILTELNDAYSNLIKARNAINETRSAYKLKKTRPDMQRKTIEMYQKAFRDSRNKIDSILNQLKEKYLKK